MKRLIQSWLAIFLLGIAPWVAAEFKSPLHEVGVHPQVELLLQSETAPDGVVFDIETLNPDALSELVGYVRYQVKRLKQTYPDVDIAIVSHGSEEFALQKQAQQNNPQLHDKFRQLVNTDGVSLHVCGAVADLKRLTQEDFPSFVSFSASGMAQLNDYKAIGYKVVTIQSLTDKERHQLFESSQDYIK